MLKVKNLTVDYQNKLAVSNLNFEIKKGESLGIIGESGSGKTTVAFSLMRLISKKFVNDKSQAFFNDIDILNIDQKQLKQIRKKIQIVFQDPFSSFNPRIKMGSAVEEGLTIHNLFNEEERPDKVREMLDMVGLSKDSYDKYPHEFSGGQRQRVALARALILNPELLIADEPVSALDVSVQAQILNLMIELREKFNLTTLFISHDLGIVDYFCDKVLVLYQGQLMEYGQKRILKQPFHPYTKLLLESLPENQENKIEVKLPEIEEIESSCPLFSRCSFRSKKCREYENQSYRVGCDVDHLTSCVQAKNG